jgi:hypothetical protein
MNSLDTNKLFNLTLKWSIIEDLILNSSILTDKNVFFQFNYKNIMIKSSIYSFCLTNNSVEKYEIYKEEDEEYEICFNAEHFIKNFMPRISEINNLVTEFITIMASMLLEKLDKDIDEEIVFKKAEDFIRMSLPEIEDCFIGDLLIKIKNMSFNKSILNYDDSEIFIFSTQIVKILQEIKDDSIINLFVLEKECKKMVICYEEPKKGKITSSKIHIK